MARKGGRHKLEMEVGGLSLSGVGLWMLRDLTIEFQIQRRSRS